MNFAYFYGFFLSEECWLCNTIQNFPSDNILKPKNYRSYIFIALLCHCFAIAWLNLFEVDARISHAHIYIPISNIHSVYVTKRRSQKSTLFAIYTVLYSDSIYALYSGLEPLKQRFLYQIELNYKV